MRIRRLGIALMISLLAGATAASHALATTTPTFVASYGDDNACTLASPCANTCTLDAPCRTFTHALTQTSSGGEIIVLDSADYDPVSITQSVSLLAGRGVSATIPVTSGHGVTVNAANIKVVLRGLSIKGLGGNHAIYFQSGASLHVEHCDIAGMSSRAINVTASSGKLFISDSVFRDGTSGGPTLDASATSASATIVRVQSLNNAGAGFNFEAGKATLRDVVVANNGGYGIHVNGGEASVTVDIDRATVRGNYTGIFVSGSGARATITASTLNQNANDGLDVSSGATAIASGNTVTWNSNGIGVYLGGGTLKSPGDNTISDNATNVQGSITSISKQ